MTKFGHRLVQSYYPPWTEHYFRYKLLKKLIKLISADSGEGVESSAAIGKLSNNGLTDSELARLEAERDASALLSSLFLESFFVELLENEQARISEFIQEEWERLIAMETEQARRGDGAVSVQSARAARHDRLAGRRLLLGFQDINYLAFFKISKKYDKATGEGILPLVMSKLDSGNFCSIPADAAYDLQGTAASTLEHGEQQRAPTPAEVCNGGSKLIDRATTLSKQAMLAQTPLLGRDEQKQLLCKTEEVQSKAMQRLEAAQQSSSAGTADAMELLEQVTRIKADVFAGFISEIIDSVSDTDPETAAALEKLRAAHNTLFHTRKQVKPESPRLIPPGSAGLTGKGGPASPATGAFPYNP